VSPLDDTHNAEWRSHSSREIYSIRVDVKSHFVVLRIHKEPDCLRARIHELHESLCLSVFKSA
jgi:hypothetical protein